MKFGSVLFLALIGIAIASDEVVHDEKVLVLTKDNFDSTVNNADIILVEFYTPWCGHCKHLAPEYGKAAETLSTNDPPIPLAKVDATVESELASRFGVRGYPTLKVFRHGNPTDYNGPREHKGIVSYMQKQVGASAKPIADVGEFKKFVEDGYDKRDISIVGFFPQKSGDAYQNFIKTADSLRDNFRFAEVNDKTVASEQGYSGEAIVVFKDFDDKRNVYGGSQSVTALTDWIYEKSLPLVGEFNKDNEARYKKRNLPIVKVYIDVDYKGGNLKRTNYYLNRIRKVADDASLSEKVTFAVVDRAAFKEEVAKFGLDSSKEVQVGIDDFSNSLKFKTSEEFSIESLRTFVKNFIDNKLKPYIKSEPLPDNSNSAVKVVVGENFNEIVMDKNKDVLLEIYAPWCGHCKKLEPAYKELAEDVAGIENLVIAKMDGAANDSPHGKYQAKGFPTILYAAANNKDNPVSYSGERDVKGFKKFLKEKASGAKWSSKKEEL